MAYILFDIGGTNTRIARCDDFASFETPIKFKTPPTFEAGMKAMGDAIRTLVHPGEVIHALGGGIRGPLNHEKTMIVSEKTLIDWVGRPLADTLSHTFNAPVYLENDTAVVGLGETAFGAGKGYSIVAYHTVSTGVGGARFVNGRLDSASVGFEPGHQELDIDRSLLGHHTDHTLENLVSGNALEKRRGVKPYEIDQADPVWNELGGYLAHGLKNTIVYWSPDVIVLGGSMIVGKPRIFLEDIVRHTEALLKGFLQVPPIVDALLKDDGGLYGSMILLSRRVEKTNR